MKEQDITKGVREATQHFVHEKLLDLEREALAAKKIQSSITSLKGLYAEIDPIVEKIAKQACSPCEAACNHCCYILTLASIPEGLVVAEKVLKRKDWKAIGRDLRRMAKDVCDPKLTHELYFKKRLACALLDQKTGLCNVYDERPVACRLHYAISEPECCAISDPPKEVRAIDFRDYERRVWAHCARLFPMMFTAPLPLVVLFCMPLLNKDKYLKQLTSGITNPARWFYLVKDQIPQLAREAVGQTGGKLILTRSNQTEENEDEDEDAR